MLEMYKGVVNSPETTITNDISSTDTLIYVLDDSRVPDDLPNLMTIGTGTNAETVKVISKDGSAITVIRGFQGIAKSWTAGSIIARNFTEYDYNALIENINTLRENTDTNADDILDLMSYVGDLESLDTDEKANIVLALNEIYQDLKLHKADYANNIGILFGSKLEWINVRQPPYNAKGDGISDDSAIINQAIADAISDGKSVYCPKPPVSYKCNSPINVPIDKISFIGDNSLFDFSSMTSGYGFRIYTTSEYENRYTHKHTFKGIVINPKVGNYGQLNITGIKIDADTTNADGTNTAHDNFEIADCVIRSCNKGIDFGDRAWRIRVVNTLFMWNTYSVYNDVTAIDCGENIHFHSCMFSDGGDIDVNCEMMFQDCSFDNMVIRAKNHASIFINNSHFERVGSGTYQTAPFIDIVGTDATVAVVNSSFITNQFKFQDYLFKVADGCTYKGLRLTNCSLNINDQQIDTATWLANQRPLCLVGGKGRVEVHGIMNWENVNTTVPISKSLNLIWNSNAEDSDTYIPIVQSSGGGTVSIDNTTAYTGTKSFKITCAPGNSFFGHIEVPIHGVIGRAIVGSMVYKVRNNNATQQSVLAVDLHFYDESGNLITKPRHNYYTLSDTNDSWKYTRGAFYSPIPSGVTKVRFSIQGLNSSNPTTLEIWLDEIVFNII